MSARHTPPHLVVVRGEPTAEEIAALTAVLAARAAAARAAAETPTEPTRPSGWRDRSRGVRAPLRPGPGAWRTSLR
ncbi:acyl-CoA carboxylase subunit epsilon [Nocardiopsis lambiniae]|uniref:Acyl-CoA carboxylase subunit epsilon n=1 Tax=Nocardiopsis lambiniae TaxID=3075539 RepID=A0ABU2MA63_9ACTN|nr:acyl-CoA carboxylase subunit epsilon [Nocardiopsis sp. DSM 44743]MDT0329141.1 acyl-CoA carboxylase subunit epsilon [Nocardiopsis sp. DSM 44743]